MGYAYKRASELWKEDRQSAVNQSFFDIVELETMPEIVDENIMDFTQDVDSGGEDDIGDECVIPWIVFSSFYYYYSYIFLSINILLHDE